ncbi:MAG: response regulator [Thiotrichales bacterium]|nr:MAG: response regulator [Thiotrichales bacterium]
MGSNSREEASDQSSWVYEKQIELLYQDLPFAIISTAVVVTLGFVFLSSSVSWQTLTLWGSLFSIVLIFRAVSNWLYSRQKKQHKLNYRHAETIFIIGVVITGLLWSGIGLWLFPEVDLKGKILLFIVIMGMAAAANTTMGYRRAPIYIFTSLLILPLVAGVVISDFPNALAISIAMLVYMAFLLRTSTGFYRNNEKTLQLQAASITNERKLLIQREKAELANQAKSEFLSLMSHELRTPLNTVLGLNELQLLDRAEPLTAKQRKRSIKINDAGRHLLSLVNDVLDFSRIETGDIEINADVIDCQAVLRDALKLIEGKANSRNIKVYIEASKHELWVLADYTRLKQILVNLLDNAVKYNRREGTITVGFKKSGADYLRISVADSGHGIPVQLQGELFKPFSRLNAEAMGIDGTGIGLSYSKQLVELMNGRIGVSSRKGQGSTFWIELPGAEQPAAEARQQSFPGPVSTRSEKDAPAGTKLLLAEDNLVNQEVAVDMLEQSGFKVAVASNGEEVLDAVRKDQYSLVFMDCEMPVLDGFAATRKLRQLERDLDLPQTPVVALTAHAVRGVREKCLASGMNDFLAKPFSFEEITSKAAQWAGGRAGVADPVAVDVAAQASEMAAYQQAAQPSVDDEPARQHEPALDRSALDMLAARKKYRKRGLVKRVVGLYLEQTPRLLEELVQAIRQADPAAQGSIAHTLKSSSLVVGAISLADTCREIEETSEQGPVSDGMISLLMQQYSDVENELLDVLNDAE